MVNITDALKDLYVAFGGEAADVDTLTNITYIANAISALLGGEGNATNVADAIENISAVVPSGGEEYEQMLNGLIGRSITEISIDTATTVGDYALYQYTNLESVYLPEVISIGDSAFYACSALRTIDLPKVISISDGAFNKCSALRTIDLPNSITSIGNAFSLCTALQTCIIRHNGVVSLPDSYPGAFYGTPIENGTGHIYVPDDLVDSYKAAAGWSRYITAIKPISELPTE